MLDIGEQPVLADRLAGQQDQAVIPGLQPAEGPSVNWDGRRIEVLRLNSAEPFRSAAPQGPRMQMPRVPSDKIDQIGNTARGHWTAMPEPHRCRPAPMRPAC